MQTNIASKHSVYIAFSDKCRVKAEKSDEQLELLLHRNGLHPIVTKSIKKAVVMSKPVCLDNFYITDGKTDVYLDKSYLFKISKNKDIKIIRFDFINYNSDVKFINKLQRRLSIFDNNFSFEDSSTFKCKCMTFDYKKLIKSIYGIEVNSAVMGEFAYVVSRLYKVGELKQEYLSCVDDYQRIARSEFDRVGSDRYGLKSNWLDLCMCQTGKLGNRNVMDLNEIKKMYAHPNIIANRLDKYLIGCSSYGVVFFGELDENDLFSTVAFLNYIRRIGMITFQTSSNRGEIFGFINEFFFHEISIHNLPCKIDMMLRDCYNLDVGIKELRDEHSVSSSYSLNKTVFYAIDIALLGLIVTLMGDIIDTKTSNTILLILFGLAIATVFSIRNSGKNFYNIVYALIAIGLLFLFKVNLP